MCPDKSLFEIWQTHTEKGTATLKTREREGDRAKQRERGTASEWVRDKCEFILDEDFII